jgi:fructokinase
VSSGFVTVDLFMGSNLRAAPGGTATNVARALKMLGWDSSVVGTIGDDPPGRFVSDELADQGVGVDFLVRAESWTTPVLLQEAARGDHRWRFQCPSCGARFAKHRPSPEGYAEVVVAGLKVPDVYFFDRASLFTLALAERWSSAGSFIVYEPAGLGRPQLFDRAARIANLLKYSAERGSAFADRLEDLAVPVVETLGSDGARFRTSSSARWAHLSSNPIDVLVDSAGAGDWTTAGILDALIRQPVGEEALESAVAAGQLLGASACSWEGVHPDALREVQGGFESFACPRVIRETSQLDA